MEALILYDKLPKDFRVQKYISTFAEDILHARCSVPEPIIQCGGTSPCSSNGALLLLMGALQCVLESGGIQLPQLPELWLRNTLLVLSYLRNKSYFVCQTTGKIKVFKNKHAEQWMQFAKPHCRGDMRKQNKVVAEVLPERSLSLLPALPVLSSPSSSEVP